MGFRVKPEVTGAEDERIRRTAAAFTFLWLNIGAKTRPRSLELWKRAADIELNIKKRRSALNRQCVRLNNSSIIANTQKFAHLNISCTSACLDCVIGGRPQLTGDWSNEGNSIPDWTALSVTCSMRQAEWGMWPRRTQQQSAADKLIRGTYKCELRDYGVTVVRF